MALSAQRQLRIWSISALVFGLVMWFLGDVLLPFIIGMAVAYLLDPMADRLQRMGLNRALSVGVISMAAVLVFVIITLLVVPTLIGQLVDLVEIAPKLATDLYEFLLQRFPQLADQNSTLNQTLVGIGEQIRDRGMVLLETLIGSAQSLMGVIVLLVIAPVVTVYMLFDWDNMVAAIDDLLPRDHQPVIRRLAREIDDTLASFVRGMLTVCLILGSYYAVALMAVGLNFGLAVGFIAGLVTFIPYLGALIGGVLAIGLALFQFWGDWYAIGLVAVIFALGQFFEGNLLTPKLVGNSVGLHPVWLLLALSVFGSLFGFVGMLIAVPLAAALGVVARFLTEEYRKGRLYQGLSAMSPPEDKDL